MLGHMRKYVFPEWEAELVVGSASIIKSIYKSVVRAGKNFNTEFAPQFLDAPKYNTTKYYGILFDYGSMRFSVVSSNTALGMIAGLY